jgi:predicted ATP-grasp superfamily ATP-dependent carboligase
MYAGALENHPKLIDEMAWIAPLWGNGGDVLSEVRDPLTLAATLRSAGHHFPDTRISANGLPMDGTWLAKTYRGASGSGVRAWRGANADNDDATERVYQQRMAGEPCAAVYVACEGAATLLGVSKQLIHLPWLHGNVFQYAGSISPFPLSKQGRAEIERVGATLAAAFELVGLFGVDFIIDGDRAWVLEVNPRYTASVEVIERATGVSAIAAHAAACCGNLVTAPSEPVHGSTCHGKAILFAERPVVIVEAFFEWALAESRLVPRPALADISPVGTTIASGRPVLTVFAAGSNSGEVERHLQDRIREVEPRLYRQ